MRNVDISSEGDIVAARSVGREIARDIGFGLANQTRLATAISELARNVVRYAGTGKCAYSDLSDQDAIRLQVVVEDHGPGIPDVEKALEDGFSTNKDSLGAGLPGTKRLVQEMDIESEPGHTKVTILVSQRKE